LIGRKTKIGWNLKTKSILKMISNKKKQLKEWGSNWKYEKTQEGWNWKGIPIL